jgi:hypothetical protein
MEYNLLGHFGDLVLKCEEYNMIISWLLFENRSRKKRQNKK